MNSDPHENAAWRNFGMLDADEAASFDEASRLDPELNAACHQMDRLTTALAVAMAAPIAPRAGQLERLQLKLGLNPAKSINWLGISGWAAAAALTLILLLDRTSHRHALRPESARQTATDSQKSVDHPPTPGGSTDEAPAETGSATAIRDSEGKTVAKVEAKRLIQEIEVLRGKLENFQKLDRKRFEAVPGMAWPIVMKMSPPGELPTTPDGLSLIHEDPLITAMLGDALSAANARASWDDPAAMATSAGLTAPPGVAAADAMPAGLPPSAIPIYDAARDSGTLVVSNLPLASATEAYSLWVTTETGGKPIYVGRLPESNALGAESFDFSLGSTAIVPSGFILTKDSQGTPASPSEENTVLLGPR